MQKILLELAKKHDWLNAKTYEAIINLSDTECKWIVENLEPDGNCLYRGIAASLEYEQFLGDVSIDHSKPKEDYFQKVKDIIFNEYMIIKENRDSIINFVKIRNQEYNLDEDITEKYLLEISVELAGEDVHADYMDILTIVISQVFKCNITIWTIGTEFNLCPWYIVNYSDSDTVNADINLLYVCIQKESKKGRIKVKETVGHYLVM